MMASERQHYMLHYYEYGLEIAAHLLVTPSLEAQIAQWRRGQPEGGAGSAANADLAIARRLQSYAGWSYHNLLGPALLKKDAGGMVRHEGWYRDGFYHNENGPALVVRAANGAALLQKYYRYGLLHNEAGPAVIESEADGSAVRAQFWREGRPAAPGMQDSFTDTAHHFEAAVWHHHQSRFPN